MGLIYIPGDAEQVKTQLTNDLQMSEDFLKRLKEATSHLTTIVGGGKLDGKAYKKGLGLMEDCVLPTIQHTTSAIDGIKQDLSNFNKAKSGMPNEPLYEDKLTAHIAELEAQKAAQTALTAVYQSHILSLIADPVGAAVDKAIHQFTDAKNQLSNWGNSVDEEIRKTTEKRDKLRHFDSTTNSLFHDSVSNLKIAMQGVEALNGSRINSDGSYSLPEGMDKSWFKKSKNLEPSKNELIEAAKRAGIPYKEFMDIYHSFQDKIGANAFGAKNFLAIMVMMKPGSLTRGKFSGFGIHGEKTFNYLMQDWRSIKKQLRSLDNPAAKKLLSSMDGSFNQFLKNIEKLKDFKGIAKYTKPLGEYAGWASDFVMKGAITAGTKLSKLKPLGKLAGKAGWVGMGLVVGYDIVTDFNKEKGDIFQKSGKSVVHAGVNQLKNAGPIEGALAGAKVGSFFGPEGTAIGAGVGFVAGGANAIWGALNPKGKDKAYEAVEHAGDWAVDKLDSAGKSVGKAVQGAWHNVTSFFGGGKHAYG
ncbi:LXG domain-containing protein [Lactococcus cremoris]|uniref:LXG domain-containing protein n=1 Tax=Lactococcus lactis subsp. cremoris TaxID=1359 RepID=UPI0021824E4C|nr:LXG domain-containing protein [Lactococcus cremoris]MCT0506597.1 hypothetical protein [Lactococcus cremoris]